MINKPEVVAIKDSDVGGLIELKPVSCLSHGARLIRLSDYEALQAECEKLRKDAEGMAKLLTECRAHLKPYHDSFMRAEAWEEGRYKQADALYRKIDAAMQRANRALAPFRNKESK